MRKPYEGVDLDVLHTNWLEATAAFAKAKFDLHRIQDELAARYGDRFTATLHNQGRDYGESTQVLDGKKIKLKVDRVVSWDEERLRVLLTELPWEVARELITMKLSVTERAFSRITDPNLRGRIEGARTVHLKPVNVSFVDG